MSNIEPMGQLQFAEDYHSMTQYHCKQFYFSWHIFFCEILVQTTGIFMKGN